MRVRRFGSSAFCAAIVLVATSTSLAQLVVDARGPIREKLKPSSAGSGGGIGRKLPLQVAIELHVPTRNGNQSTEVEVDFILTNSSAKEFLTIPVSPHPGDLEAANPKASYSLRRISLYLTSTSKGERSMLPGAVHLFGSDAFAGTLTTLPPGKAIRVLARVTMQPTPAASGNSAVLVAHAVLSDETTRVVDGNSFTDSEEIGSAISPEYTPEALLKSAD